MPCTRHWQFFLWALLLTICACARSPFTGRRAFQLFPEGQLHELAAAEYEGFLAQHQVTENERLAAQVRGIGERIAVAAQVALEGEGEPERLEGYEWEFNVVESEQVNAFCMPGGKVVVFTGLLPIARDEASLAVVMGHEIAHAIAEHGNERMSQMVAAELGGVALQVALRERPAQVRQMFSLAYGVGTAVGVLLPFSRAHESEADEIGLYLSTIAGYDPRAAAPLWERMAQVGPAAPTFLSTHPDPLRRAERLRELVPEALRYREKYGAELERRMAAQGALVPSSSHVFAAAIGNWTNALSPTFDHCMAPFDAVSLLEQAGRVAPVSSCGAGPRRAQAP